MRILFLGDIFGKPGRKAVESTLPKLRSELDLDMVIANCENASRGIGLTLKSARSLLSAGIDIATTGNHIWRFKDIYSELNSNPRIIRPANFTASSPGCGYTIHTLETGTQVAVINLQGRVFMPPIECPFAECARILESIPEEVKVRIIDFHAEATSEKLSLARHYAHEVSAVLGTHTHVQTNDACLLEKRCAYITDAGMCGPVDSCLGLAPEPVIKRFITGLPQKWYVADGPVRLSGALMEIDEDTGRALSVSAWNMDEL